MTDASFRRLYTAPLAQHTQLDGNTALDGVASGENSITARARSLLSNRAFVYHFSDDRQTNTSKV